MREIKIRVWNKSESRMDYNPTIFINKHEEGESTPYYINDIFNKDGYIWMQYTGCKDSDGKEVYDGDILKVIINSHTRIYPALAEVIYYRGAYILRETVDGHVFSLYSNLSLREKDGLSKEERTTERLIECWIKGNVYENINLLSPKRREDIRKGWEYGGHRAYFYDNDDFELELPIPEWESYSKDKK